LAVELKHSIPKYKVRFNASATTNQQQKLNMKTLFVDCVQLLKVQQHDNNHIIPSQQPVKDPAGEQLSTSKTSTAQADPFSLPVL
jgi:hypothetical protein